MDSPELQPQNGDAETPGQKQARLRRERREAKIKAGGSSRLEKITNVSGRQDLPDPPPPAPTADPDEVDLSTHPSAAPRPTNNAPTEADIRALLRGSGAPGGVVDEPQQGPGEEDPMMKLLQQMMGGGMPGQGGGGGEGGLPPGLAAMLGAGGISAAPSAGATGDQHAYLWKIIHALFALLLGVYITATSHAFTGDVSRGGISGEGHEGGKNVFWAFATAELVLQSSRFFLEKGAVGKGLGGWMGVVVGMLPEPWRGWVRLGGRYAGIWRTVVEDGMVVVFVVGCVAWWKGAVG